MRHHEGTRIYGPYEHKKCWRIHIVETSGGRRKTRYRSYKTLAEAEAYLDTAGQKAQGITLRMAVDRFLEAKRARELAGTTIENYEFRLRRLLGLDRNGNRPMRWLVGRGAELYEASAYGAGDTHINGLMVGRMWATWCVKQKLLRANPFDDVETIGRRRKGSGKSRLTVNECRKLEAHCFAHADDPDCVLTYGYLMLGKRASELVGIRVRDLDDNGWLVRIVKAKTEASEGDIAIPVQLRDMLLALASGKKPDAYLFVNYSGRPMSRYTARDRVRDVCAEAKVQVLPPQALRRTFVDNAKRQRIALRSIAEMVGHTTPAVTGRSYMDPGVAEAEAVERNFKVIQGGAS